jgi:hypothetical protein
VGIWSSTYGGRGDILVSFNLLRSQGWKNKALEKAMKFEYLWVVYGLKILLGELSMLVVEKVTKSQKLL